MDKHKKELELLVRRAKAGNRKAREQLNEFAKQMQILAPVHMPREVLNVMEAADDSSRWKRIGLDDVIKILEAARGRPGRRRTAKTQALIEKLAERKAAGTPYYSLASRNPKEYNRLRKISSTYKEEISRRAAQLSRE
jgi:hypothetical protein